MIRRLTFPLLLCGLLFTGLLPSTASAHGPALRGRLLDRSNVPVAGMTGNCACNRQWYTMGLQPGPFNLSMAVSGCRGAVGPTCGIFAFLYRGSREVQTANVGCSSKGACAQPLQLTYRVTKGGVYYLLVQGTGANSIWYRMTVRARIYRLHCGKYC